MIDLLCGDNPVWEATALLPSLPPDAATAPISELLARASEIVRDGGGSAHNTAVAAARLGRSVAVVGRVGDDEEGRQATAALQGLAAHIAVSAGRRTKRSFIFKGPDDRGLFRVEVPERAVLPLRPADVPADLLSGARLLHLDRVTDTALALARRRSGRPVSLDLHTCPGRPLARERLDALLPLLAVLQLSEAAARDIGALRGLSEIAAVAAALAAVVPWVVVTLGERGSVAASGARVVGIPPSVARVVDSTGAGDAHAAALLDGWLDGLPLYDAATRAARAGALACAALGARGAVIRLEDLSPAPGAAR
ncbi:MAG: hypothetical protein AMXMBFR64_01840 [Myxococcales bacterium]